MKNMSVAAFIVSIVVGTQSLADSCSPEKAQKKAGLAAVLIDQVSFDRKGVSVVASVQIMIQDSQATYSVQTRGS